MNIVHLIEKKRDGKPHTKEELKFIANSAAQGTVQDYQLSAWLMAAFLNPLSDQETADFTLAMAESGDRINLTGLPKPWLDKHSTGGVGDKTTIVLLPLLAACGLTLVKMSGRGLGITGGTVDKLSSVPGFNISLSPDQMKEQANQIGLAITGQTPSLAPADKKLYSLRDVTATVPSMPLIASSILSKKIAGGAEVILLDVKSGSGAFMKTKEEALELANLLEKIGEIAQLKVKTVVTDMNQPLGTSAGNALEIKEAIRVLKGEEKGTFRTLCLTLAQSALVACGITDVQPEDVLNNGSALNKAQEWFSAQKGDLSVFESENWQIAPYIEEITANTSGYVQSISAQAIGQAVVDLGGGRAKKEDDIDPTVGIETLIEIGDLVSPGQVIGRIHAKNREQAESAKSTFLKAITISNQKVNPLPIIVRG